MNILNIVALIWLFASVPLSWYYFQSYRKERRWRKQYELQNKLLEDENHELRIWAIQEREPIKEAQAPKVMHLDRVEVHPGDDLLISVFLNEEEIKPSKR
jgi:hypothetical protein